MVQVALMSCESFIDFVVELQIGFSLSVHNLTLIPIVRVILEERKDSRSNLKKMRQRKWDDINSAYPLFEYQAPLNSYKQ